VSIIDDPKLHSIVDKSELHNFIGCRPRITLKFLLTERGMHTGISKYFG
jgi:hypothetical protein